MLIFDDATAWEPRTLTQMKAHAGPAVDWVWPGYLARGGVTLLTSQWKTGKTTLLSVLIARMNGGGKTADREVIDGRVGIVTEESEDHWRRRGESLDFGEAMFFCRPFTNRPTPERWRSFIEHLVAVRRRSGLDLVVFDTLASFLPPGIENHPQGMLETLQALERLTSEGCAVLLLHHPRKGATAPGQASRGTGALSGYCDVIVEMTTLPGCKPENRRRRLSAWSRYDETPRELIVELSADGLDYTASDEPIDLPWEQNLDVIRTILKEFGRQMTREMLLRRWPEQAPKPASSTLWRWIDRAVGAGFLIQNGRGDPLYPYRYSLPGVEMPWEDSDQDLLMTGDEAMMRLQELHREAEEFEQFMAEDDEDDAEAPQTDKQPRRAPPRTRKSTRRKKKRI